MTKKKILIVEDDKQLGESLVELLDAFDFETALANSGNAAIKFFDGGNTENIDVILSDVRMPNGDGIFLLDELSKKDFPIPKFIFLTGYADFTLDEVKEKGCSAILMKPLDLDQLLDIVND